MMRQADSAIRLLFRLLANRKQTESDPQDYDRGARLEHIAGVAMTQVLAEAPVSYHDPESQNHTTETPARLSADPIAKIITKPAERAVATQDLPHPTPVSSRDPESRETETETPPRQATRWRPVRPDPADFPLDPALLVPDLTQD